MTEGRECVRGTPRAERNETPAKAAAMMRLDRFAVITGNLAVAGMVFCAAVYAIRILSLVAVMLAFAVYAAVLLFLILVTLFIILGVPEFRDMLDLIGNFERAEAVLNEFAAYAGAAMPYVGSATILLAAVSVVCLIPGGRAAHPARTGLAVTAAVIAAAAMIAQAAGALGPIL